MLILNAIGPRGEELAMEAAKLTDIPAGFDPEFKCATYDSETLSDGEMQGIVFDALAGLDSEWQAHLSIAE